MSVAGTYKIQVKTPVGLKEGKMILAVEGEALTGRLEYYAGKSDFKNGKVKGNTVEFTTTIKTPMGHLRAFVRGMVEGDSFSGVAKLPMGTAQIYGRRV